MPTERSALALPIRWTREQVIRVVWLVSAVALGAQSRGGADFGRYNEWLKAFSSYDILKIKSVVLSPVGVPMTHWSHAPALVSDAIGRVLSLLPVKIGVHTVPWLAAIAFWWALIGLVRLVTRGDPLLLVLTVAVAFLGTHAGFYSTHHSSEIFSLVTFAVAVFWALSAGPERLRDSLIVGVACGLLLIVRVNLIMYVPLPLAARAFIVWRSYGDRLNKAVVFHALALGVPLLAYGVQLLLFNYWMTGSPSHSPYVYGDANFRSVDFAHPLVGTMLFHSWHGLLSYHPLYALGALALAALALRRDLPLVERLFCGYALLAMLLQFYIQASWWCWWNGTGTFGCRTLALAGVLVVVALARWLYLLKESATRKDLNYAFVLLGLTAASCLWSLLLYLQGDSNYVTWRELLDAQRQYLFEPTVSVPLVVATAMSLGYGVFAFRRFRHRAALVAITAFIATLAAQGLLADPLAAWHFTPALYGIVSAVAFSAIIYLATDGDASPSPSRLARTAVAGAVLWVFVVGNWAFTQLAVATNSVIANSTANPRLYRYRSTMVLDDLLACLPEYDRVEGFTRRKLAARRFLEAAAQEARQK
ncbi:MAG: hypothetical protein WDO69_26155 [Pseudomonadota bacterium]